MDTTNWINLGIFLATVLVGILTWLATRQSAREAQRSQEQANVAASRSAQAAEDAAKSQKRLLEIEDQRHQEAAIDAKRAKLHAKLGMRQIHGHGRQVDQHFLRIANSGLAPALGVEIHLDGLPIISFREFAGRLPNAAIGIGPTGNLDLPFDQFRGGTLHIPFRVSLVWSDESGIEGEWEGTVS